MKQTILTTVFSLIAVAFYAIAPAIVFALVPLPYYIGVIFASAGVLFTVCALIANAALTHRAYKKILETPLSVWQTQFMKRREDIREREKKETKKVSRVIARAIIYNLLLCLAFLLINCGGVIILRDLVPFSEDFGVVEFCALSAAACAFTYVFYMPAVTALFRKPPKTNQYFQRHLNEISYPKLYAVARKSAKAVNYKGAFLLYPNPDDGISVSEDNGICSINLSPEMVSLLTEEELYSVLVHEFAHAVHADTKLLAKYKQAAFRYSEPQHMKALSNAFFSYCAFRIQTETDILLQYASVLRENAADGEVKKLELGQTFMNATAKSYLFSEIFREPIEEFSYGIYAGEAAPNDYYAQKVEYFKAHAKEYYPHALEIMLRRLSAYNDSHPTFAMRAEAFGITEFDPFTYPEGDYADEVKAFCAYCDKELCSSLASEWQRMHEEHFLFPKEICERYEAAPENASAFLKLLALNSYYSRDYSKTLALAENLLREDADCNCALFYKGIILCARDDEAGLPLLLEALRVDYNLSDAFDAYGETILRTGKQELLDELRKMQAPFGQEMLDKLKKRYKNGIKLKTDLVACSDDEKRNVLVNSIEAIAQNYLTELYLAQTPTPEGGTRYFLFMPYPYGNPAKEQAVEALQRCFGLSWRKNEEYFVYFLTPNNKLWKKVKSVGYKIV